LALSDNGLAEPLLNTFSTPGPLFFGADIQHSGIFRRRWIYHSIFWLLYFWFLVLLYTTMYMVHSTLFFVEMLGPLFVQGAFIYFNMRTLIPLLLFRKRYVQYGLALCLGLAITALLMITLNKVYVHYGSKLYAKFSIYNVPNVLVYMIDVFYLVGLTTGIKFLKDSIINRQWMEEKEKQYLQTELNFLKSQIQPHFFFNTLNNLYSLTLKKSDLAPEIVLKLSALMSYMLYESNTPLVPLDKEISYLRNYLDVEQLRFGQRLSVSFSLQGETKEMNIPPMILILFIENSFKHGVKNNINKIHIDISLLIGGGFLHFHIENPAPEDELSTENAGIGLKNGRRRLDLLYGDAYSLDISMKKGLFIVELKIPVC